MHKQAAYGGVFTALGILLITLAAYLPSAKAAALFAASLAVFVLTDISGVRTALLSYAATAILGIVISNGASPAVIVSYAVCFGNYPVFKKVLDGKKCVFSVIFKAVLYIVYFAAVFVIFKMFIKVDLMYSTSILFVAGAALFAFYDILLARTKAYALNIINKKI